MNVLDWCLLALVGIYALSGYWQGFITGASATAGLLLGGLAGIWVAPLALGDAAPSLWVSLGALFIVIISASLGQALFQYVGARLRDRITWQPIRAVDAIGGSVLSAVAVLLVAWALGVAVSGTRIGAVTPLVRDSTILAEVGGTSVTASVVLYDPALDIAVLALPDTGSLPLAFDTEVQPRDPVAVLGYPEDGPYDVESGRVRSEQRLRSPDIYGEGIVIRQVFSLRGLIRPGNSGGPIVTSAGDVAGMVFAASVSDPDTGYALTADQVTESAADGVTATSPVDTGTCVR